MQRKSRRTNIIAAAAVAALITTLGGGLVGANAAGLITGKQVKNNSLTGADIHNIRGGDIAGRTIQCRNLSTAVQGSVTACNGGKTVTGSNGSVVVNAEKGAKGDAGRNGINGAPGAAGVVGNVLHNSHSVDVPAGANGTEVQVTCAGGDYGDAPNGSADGYVAVGGGFNVASRDPGVYVSQSRNLISLNGDYAFNGKGWLVQVNNTTATPQNVRAWVICINAPGDNPDD